MKFPEQVRRELARRFRNRHRGWLAGTIGGGKAESGDGADIKPAGAGDRWPLEVNLGIPTENQALRQVEDVRCWVEAWQSWRGGGSISWADRRWSRLGTQRLPGRLTIGTPLEAARWIGEGERWERAAGRFAQLAGRWPGVRAVLPRYFGLLADYSEDEYRRLIAMAEWLKGHPSSNLYPRQLPVPGVDGKWLESRKRVLADLVGGEPGELGEPGVRGGSGGAPGGGDFFERCGLKAPPRLIRLRILDAELRGRVGGLGDISVPWEEAAGLDLPAEHVFIVENLQTGLAFGDLPGAVAVMQLGYGVEVLGRLPWAARGRSVYWGDLDTHGFAILNRARRVLPSLHSILMDEETLLIHKDLWVEEPEPCGAESLPSLNEAEYGVYRGLKGNIWGVNVRLEQERIAWDYAWERLAGLV